MKQNKKIKNENRCPDFESSLKSYFLAPNAENRDLVQFGIIDALHVWFDWRKTVNKDTGPFFHNDEMTSTASLNVKLNLLNESRKLSQSFSKEIPRHSPNYIGHMFSDFTIPAFIGNFIALMYNPNNISSESSTVGLELEKKSISILQKMLGFKKGIGHFTSGGTIANFEMIFRAKFLALKKRDELGWKKMSLLVPASAHYSWKKGCDIIGGAEVDLVLCPLNKFGQFDSKNLKSILELEIKRQRLPMAVISVVGTTELGIIDPVGEIQDIIQLYSRKIGFRIWHHVDGAYGGFLPTLFKKEKKGTVKTKFSEEKKSILAMSKVDSVTIDPHKLGYAPYSSGAFICAREKDYYCYGVDAPYINYNKKSDPGPFTLEGSRSAASACAVYLTAQTIGYDSTGLGTIIQKSIENKNKLVTQINKSAHFKCAHFSPMNILVFSKLKETKKSRPARKLSEVNKLTEKTYHKLNLKMKSQNDTFYISKTIISAGFEKYISEQCQKWNIEKDVNRLMLLRCTVMNPFFSSKHSQKNAFEEFVNWIEING